MCLLLRRVRMKSMKTRVRMSVWARAMAKQVQNQFGMDVEQLRKEARSIAPFLIPFLKMSAIYFVLWLPEDQPSLASAIVKCLPILSLIWFVWLQGISGEIANSYNFRIFIGLSLSCIGDALLIWAEPIPSMFLAGMFSFGCAQITYIFAFGFTPFGLKELVFVASLGVPVAALFFSDIPGFLWYAVTAYMVVLLGMSWRALARFNLQGDIPWRKIWSAVGAVFFVVSDLTIALNKFYCPVPFSRTLIMVTYYAAQLCLSLSVINSRLFIQRNDAVGRGGVCGNCACPNTGRVASQEKRMMGNGTSTISAVPQLSNGTVKNCDACSL